MADYIDRDKLIDMFCSQCMLVGKEHCFVDCFDITNIRKLIPSADVQPVVHGHWVMEEYDYPCSVCGETVAYEYDVRILKYCPNCGARMDGVDDG